MGCDNPVILDKMFGPTVFQSLRVTASLEDGGWVIERGIASGSWTCWCVIPAQTEVDEHISELLDKKS